MNEATILVTLGTVEITDGGKKLVSKKNSKISLDAIVKTAANGKIDLEVEGNTYSINGSQTITVKNLLNSGEGGIGKTDTAGVRG